jgi:hypothetical protein
VETLVAEVQRSMAGLAEEDILGEAPAEMVRVIVAKLS